MFNYKKNVEKKRAPYWPGLQRTKTRQAGNFSTELIPGRLSSILKHTLPRRTDFSLEKSVPFKLILGREILSDLKVMSSVQWTGKSV